ncbi:hypothetical protein D9M73_171930 [compost metagenome]
MIIRRSITNTPSSKTIAPVTASSSIRCPSTDTSRGTVKAALATACPSAPWIGTAMRIVALAATMRLASGALARSIVARNCSTSDSARDVMRRAITT